jgi:poly-gamma-glutamate system protein
MLNILNQKNIIIYKLSAVSMGGNHDQAEGMFFPDSSKIIENIAEQSNTHFINTGSLGINIRERIRIYQETAGEKPIKLFVNIVNIGGASANFGDTVNSINFPNGLVLGGVEIPAVPERGLLFDFLAAGIPVIHLLNIRD